MSLSRMVLQKQQKKPLPGRSGSVGFIHDFSYESANLNGFRREIVFEKSSLRRSGHQTARGVRRVALIERSSEEIERSERDS